MTRARSGRSLGRGGALPLGHATPSRVLLPVAIALSFPGANCRRESGDPPPTTIRIGHEAEVISLDPVAVSEAATHSVLSNVFESLATFDKDMSLKPGLAISWSTPDERTWVVRLRKGVRFHDGRVLSAVDVEATFDRARSDPASGVKGQLWSVEHVEAIDDASLKLTTLRPDPLLMARLTYLGIVPRTGFADAAGRPIGTGPYRFVRWEKGRVLEAEAFPDYWGGRPAIDRVQFASVPQEESLERLRRGELDVLRDLPEAQLERFASLPGIHVLARPGLSSNYLWIDSRPRLASAANPFHDRRVRQALSLAIDRPRIVKELGGRGTPAAQLVQQGVFGYVEGLPALRYDPEEARRLLGDAGFAQGFEAILSHSGSWGEAAGEKIRTMLAEAGVRLTLRRLDWPEVVSRWKQADLPLFVSGWRFENGDATSFLRDCLYTRDHVRGSGGFNPGFSNPAFDRLIDENDQIFGEDKRRAHYDKVMRLALDDMPIVPLYHRANLYGVSTRLRWEPRLDGKLLAAEMAWE